MKYSMLIVCLGQLDLENMIPPRELHKHNSPSVQPMELLRSLVEILHKHNSRKILLHFFSRLYQLCEHAIFFILSYLNFFNRFLYQFA
jgi:hypothetical protein